MLGSVDDGACFVRRPPPLFFPSVWPGCRVSPSKRPHAATRGKTGGRGILVLKPWYYFSGARTGAGRRGGGYYVLGAEEGLLMQVAVAAVAQTRQGGGMLGSTLFCYVDA